MSDKKFYLDVLKDEECQCGRFKKRGMALCYGCYDSLPKDMKNALWQPVGGGFGPAYEEAVRYLT